MKAESRCYLEISTENFRDNLLALKNYLGEDTKILGIVKADYYGHGDYSMAEVMKQCGITDYAVAALYEAVGLRKAGVTGSIVDLGYIEKDSWMDAYKYDVIMSAVDYDNICQMNDFAVENNITLKVAIKVDTGMRRLGFDSDLDEQLVKQIYSFSNLQVVYTYSHLCVADSFEEENRQFTYLQKERFDNFIAKARKYNLSVGATSLCASSGLLNYPDFKYDYVRPGFLPLGFRVGDVNLPFEIKPVLSWYSKIEMIKTVKANEGISYGLLYRCPTDKKIATISVGYGDGYPRRLSNKGYVMINGQRANIVGRICMDQLMVDVTDIDCQREDIVTLIGEGISANQLANMADTIVDEIVCNINRRVQRVVK